jgi:acetoin:2,6-dichlorophenolindophenol oxidoreductase subunit alpha
MMRADPKFDLYRTLLRARRLDEFARRCLTEGAIRLFWHSSAGAEAVGVGAASAFAPDDYVWYHYRGHGLPYLLGRGGDPRPLFAEHFGKATGSAKGRSGFHIVAPEVGIYGFFGYLGAGLGVSVGYGMSAKLRESGQAVLGALGDGTAQKGQFHESMNMSALWKLPIVWVCENNGWVVYTPRSGSFAIPSGHFSDLVRAYGIPVNVVDGQDVFAVAEAVKTGLDHVRSGEGPYFVEAMTYRFRTHAEGQPDLAYDKPRMVEGLERDPVEVAKAMLIAEGKLTEGDSQALELEIAAEISEIERFCRDAPEILPSTSDFESATYA